MSKFYALPLSMVGITPRAMLVMALQEIARKAADNGDLDMEYIVNTVILAAGLGEMPVHDLARLCVFYRQAVDDRLIDFKESVEGGL